ncbi:tyrosine-type recombinase/integrase [Paenibacillus sp. J5C_2022]|uniref:tyrosine-type recombinase/integrase n=1 Tax=Paenibacillus sp. J5C2022 TaxID=2977129 RepID=UPI0021D20E00|nr:tyrosine-type recombinase/integrase [Paenibacillus sp. J5C2022]MCU6709797.1 tyrosine-type recombinase/integrase [Paenibacillus sp. J5C2022]
MCAKRRKNTIAGHGYGASKRPPESEDFDIAVNTFIRNCKIRNLSESTISYYRVILKVLREHVTKSGIDRPSDVTAEHIHEFSIERRESGSPDTTVNMYNRGWRAFFNFMAAEGYVEENPYDHVAKMKSESKIIQTFSKPQIKTLLSAPDKTKFTGYRDYVLMLLLLETGIRISEAEGIVIPNINWRERRIKVYGKGRKERYVPFQQTLDKHLRQYLEIRGLLDHDFLFVNIDNTPAKVRTMQENIQAYGAAAGLKGVRVSPHTFRHTMAKMYVMNGGDPLSLQIILGHTSLEMVRNYVKLFSQDVAAKHAKHSPLESLYSE